MALKKLSAMLLLPLITCFFSVSFGWAAEWDITSETILRSFQRSTIQGDDENIMPLYEYLSIDYGNHETGGISFHGHGWLRKDLMSSDLYEDDPDGELLYAYLSYSRPHSAHKISLGRQHIFAGVANESVDGVRVDLGLGNYAALSAYGGIPVDLEETEGRSRDLIYGGRLALLIAPAAEVGVSYKYLEDNGELYEETMGADLFWSPLTFLALNGRSAYNLETRGWREHNYSAQINAAGFEFAPTYQHFRYEDYFSSAENRNNLFRFLFDSEERLTTLGADASWGGLKIVEIGVRGRRYEYELRDTTAMLISGLLTLNFTPAITLGAEAGSMDGETPEDSYQLYRAYIVWSPGTLLGPSGQISADLLYQAFDQAIYGVDTALFASLSAGRSFIDEMLMIKASLNYSQDPFFDDDLSGILTFAINY